MNVSADNNSISLQKLTAALLTEKHKVKVRLGGSSMYPYLKDGDMATIEPFDLEKLEIGSVVVFRRNNRWFAHRLLKKEDGYLLTKGDAVFRKDPPVSHCDYLGLVIGIERNGKNKDTTSPSSVRRNRIRAFFSGIIPFLRYF